MAKKILKIKWEHTTVELALADNPIAEFYYSCMRRLQHLDLFFGPRETPYHPLITDVAQARQLLQTQLQDLHVSADATRFDDQSYLNHLHDIYFQQCNTQDRAYYTRWTHAHDTIHLLEMHNQHRQNPAVILFNYRNDAGPLYKKFNRDWLEHAVQSVEPGTCFLTEQELGKNPLTYFKDQEPNDIDFMCRVSKPWVNLIPTMNVAVDTIAPDPIPTEFLQWFGQYQDQWCQHWGITGWTAGEIYAKIPIGQILNFDELHERFKHNEYPTRITQ